MFSALFNAVMSFVGIFLRVSNTQSFPPPLSAQDEKRYFELARKGDSDAREKLIEHNLRLVAHIVKKYYTGSDESEDLMSIGTIGLIKAIDSFDVSNGARFATYAGKCLQNEILMHFRSKKKLQNEVSINEAIDMDKDGNPLTYIDIICCEDTIAEDINSRMYCKKALEIVNTKLSEREKEIIVLRYGLNMKPSKTQREIAKQLGISRSYVSRIEKAALQKIRDCL
ncbi:MAG: sigma-70 family RNA polymerase sigma factor [Ruminococcaceae bacterium]|nr:sigma-70 family RNA polymerase sigma factor [Oscillospiraceae bacterium]